MSSAVDRTTAPTPGDAVAVPRARPRSARGTGRRCFDVLAGFAYLAARSVADLVARTLGSGRAHMVILYYHAVPVAHRARFARQLDAIRRGADAVVPADFCGRVAPGRLLVAITFDDAFRSVIDNALPELVARGMVATIFTPSGILGRPPSWEMEADDSDQVEIVAQADSLCRLPHDLIAIGSHSVTHPCLPELDRDAAMAEIGGSKAALAGLLGRDVTTFSFPYGEFDDRTVELCRTAAFRFAYHTLPRTLDPADASFLRGRVRVDMSDWPVEFWLKLRGAYSWQCAPREFKRWLRHRRARQPQPR